MSGEYLVEAVDIDSDCGRLNEYSLDFTLFLMLIIWGCDNPLRGCYRMLKNSIEVIEIWRVVKEGKKTSVAKKVGKLKWRSRKDINTRITAHCGLGAVARGDGEGEVTVYDLQHYVVNEDNNPKLCSQSLVALPRLYNNEELILKTRNLKTPIINDTGIRWNGNYVVVVADRNHTSMLDVVLFFRPSPIGALLATDQLCFSYPWFLMLFSEPKDLEQPEKFHTNLPKTLPLPAGSKGVVARIGCSRLPLAVLVPSG
ncbi:hypothetical protein ACTXT7_008066 [Hymenolepis weldensis]